MSVCLSQNGGCWSYMNFTYQDLAEVLVWHVGQFGRMELWDNELAFSLHQILLKSQSPISDVRRILTAWPMLRGLMSRNARVLSLSKSLRQGISPGTVRNNEA
jgi:hypothetical protein